MSDEGAPKLSGLSEQEQVALPAQLLRNMSARTSPAAFEKTVAIRDGLRREYLVRNLPARIPEHTALKLSPAGGTNL